MLPGNVRLTQETQGFEEMAEIHGEATEEHENEGREVETAVNSSTV